jgi:hypothetical protein
VKYLGPRLGDPYLSISEIELQKSLSLTSAGPRSSFFDSNPPFLDLQTTSKMQQHYGKENGDDQQSEPFMLEHGLKEDDDDSGSEYELKPVHPSSNLPHFAQRRQISVKYIIRARR